MNLLLTHLIQHHVTRQRSHIIDNLTQLNQLTLKSTGKISQEDLQLMQYLLEKKIINYQPSIMTLKINIHSVLFYQRVYKLRKFCRKFMSTGFADLFERFCQNELMPMAVESSELKKMGVKSKQTGDKEEGGKQHQKKKQTNQNHHFIDYNTLIYEYKQKDQGKKQSEVEIVINIDEITQLYRYHLAINRLTKEQREELRQALKIKQHSKVELMFIEVYNTVKENSANAQIFKQCTTKLRQVKVEEYILQSFKKHHPTEQLRQQLSRNVLLVYNLVKKYPLISEKELVKLSLLQIVQQRKCLNLLISEGIIHYFSESIKSVLYKVLNMEQIQKKVVNAIAHAILNMHVVIGERKVSKQQMLKMQAMLQSLDDSLLLISP